MPATTIQHESSHMEPLQAGEEGMEIIDHPTCQFNLVEKWNKQRLKGILGQTLKPSIQNMAQRKTKQKQNHSHGKDRLTKRGKNLAKTSKTSLSWKRSLPSQWKINANEKRLSQNPILSLMKIGRGYLKQCGFTVD